MSFIKDMKKTTPSKAKEILETIRHIKKTNLIRSPWHQDSLFDKDGSTLTAVYKRRQSSVLRQDKGKNTYELYRDVMCRNKVFWNRRNNY